MASELVIISGKGGTGKTSIVGAISHFISDKIIVDTDVDASDLHLLLSPEILEEHEFVSGHEPVILRDRCIECGLCRELCKWDAISEDFTVDTISCEGCGVCYYFCPEKAIDFVDRICGRWFISETRFGPFLYAHLDPGEENSGKLVTLLRQKAGEVAKERGVDLIITDGPPGIGCPVIASIGGAKAVLIVTEPTISGIHDFERIADLSHHFKVPPLLCINKADVNLENRERIIEISKRKGVEFIGEIPFDMTFTEAMVNGKTIVEYAPDSASSLEIKKIWERLSLYL